MPVTTLIAVTLIAWSATSGLITGLMPEGVIAFDTPIAAHAQASIKRYLRSDVALTPSDDTKEERAEYVALDAGLEQIGQGIIREIQDIHVDRLIHATPNGNIFDYPKFKECVSFFERTYPNPPQAAARVMFDFLINHYNDKTLASALVAGTKIDSMRDTAEKLLDIQIEKWGHASKSVIEVFKLLELHQTGNELFMSELFSKWVTFAKSRFGSMADVMMIMTLVEHVKRNYDDLVALLNAAGENSIHKDLINILRDKEEVKRQINPYLPDLEVFKDKKTT